MDKRFGLPVLLAACALSGPVSAQFAVEDDQGVGVTNAADFSYRYYLDQMDRFPERLGIICVSAYELDKTGHHDQSLMFFTECARRGNAPAMVYLSLLYEVGLGTAADPVAATDWLRRAAETGYAPGQYEYGLALLRGQGVGADRAAARHWFSLAAAQGDDDARRRLEALAAD